jgi:hypothetical protein
MSKDMKLIMESWRKNVITEAKALELHEQLIQEFIEELKVLSENKADLNEVLGKVGAFARKYYDKYSEIKKGGIKRVLTAAINGALKIIPLVKDKAPNVASKVERILNELKKDENMTVAVSIVSILIGLLTGEFFDAIEEVLSAIDAAPNIIQAYKTIQNIRDAVDIKKAADQTGQLADVAALAE